MFKVGDMVKVKSGADTRLRKSDEFEVKAISDTGKIFIKEYDFQGKLDSFDPMIFTLSGGNSPIRTVTRREIVPGTYGAIKVLAASKSNAVIQLIDSNGSKAKEAIAFTSGELREAAHLFSQLAEALEDKP